MKILTFGEVPAIRDVIKRIMITKKSICDTLAAIVTRSSVCVVPRTRPYPKRQGPSNRSCSGWLSTPGRP